MDNARPTPDHPRAIGNACDLPVSVRYNDINFHLRDNGAQLRGREIRGADDNATRNSIQFDHGQCRGQLPIGDNQH